MKKDLRMCFTKTSVINLETCQVSTLHMECIQLWSVISIWAKQGVVEQSGLKHKMRKDERLRRRACRLKAFAHAKEDALTGTLGGIGIAYGAAGSRGQGLLTPVILARTLAGCYS